MNTDKIISQVAVLIEQGRYVAKKLEQVETKVDKLTISHTALKWKVLTASSIFAFLTTLAVMILVEAVKAAGK
jgi:hypothetical protein